MLDENLPAFFFKRAADGTQHHEAVLQSYQGSDPTPSYTLKHADPKLQASRNCYAAALFDSYNPEVLFGEVLVQPTWTKPTLSQEEIRRNGGVPPPPQAIIPGEFTIQLYEPDQQVVVRRKSGGIASSSSYEFDMPQTSFRTPSVSTLDRTQSDPLATATTTKLQFAWRKEGKLSKDYTCFMTGKSTDTVTKKSKRDPDIAIALFRSLREVTIYEPNLSRVELEDLKGLEVVIILAAATIRDIYIGNNLREIFNIEDPPTRKLSSGGRKVVPTPSQIPPQPSKPANGQRIPTTVNPNLTNPQQAPTKSPQIPSPAQAKPTPPTAGKDARQQWAIDAETARLKAQVASEEKEAARLAAQRKRDKEKADEAETKRLRKLVEAEQKEAKKKQRAVEEETERLRRKYGQNLPSLPVRPGGSSGSGSNTGAKIKQRPPQPQAVKPQRPHVNTGGGGLLGLPSSRPPQQQRPPMLGGGGGMYMQPNKSAYVMSGAIPAAGPSGPRPKKSFWGLKDLEEEMKRVSRKKSSIW
ncbi:Protein transport protein SEC31 [Sphaceloma murrayae]|uniref:Protein transport protein SEC31 n=1 Tax=Sphaceloma murrayae TaxID=2082308 RepID=A0A2K1R358_9PEZI|nr:Protein transport protein SEC31 [Sphaceloma murrayae]